MVTVGMLWRCCSPTTLPRRNTASSTFNPQSQASDFEQFQDDRNVWGGRDLQPDRLLHRLQGVLHHNLKKSPVYNDVVTLDFVAVDNMYAVVDRIVVLKGVASDRQDIIKDQSVIYFNPKHKQQCPSRKKTCEKWKTPQNDDDYIDITQRSDIP
jgi:hypothetical protein